MILLQGRLVYWFASRVMNSHHKPHISIPPHLYISVIPFQVKTHHEHRVISPQIFRVEHHTDLSQVTS